MTAQFTTNAGKALAALRKRVHKTCEICGTEIVVLRQAKYCSNRCRQKAKYQRQKVNCKQSDTCR